MTAKKEQRELIPKIELNNPDKTLSILEKINEETAKELKLKEIPLQEVININPESSQYADTFFKKVIEELFSGDNIDLKTEYLNEDEQFEGTKLAFLSEQCGFEMIKNFLPLWERKRVSFQRKSRQEIVMGLWERQKEVRALEEKQKAQNQLQM